MKITLDLTDLVATGKLTEAEAERLRGFAARDTGSLGINILVGFGVVAVALGAGALVPSPLTAVALGAVMFAFGFAVMSQAGKTWELLAQICIVIGTLGFCGGLVVLENGSLGITMAIAVILAAAAVLARSGLLIAAAVLVVGACLGSSSDYSHAMYSLTVEEPTLTIVTFGLIALAGYIVSLRVAPHYERLALIGARTAILMLNFGFWIGSLWGDHLTRLRSAIHSDPTLLHNYSGPALIPAWLFSLGWALVLAGAGAWAVKVNRRWVVNVVAVFGAIHFYTQWFEKLGANPATVLLAGLLMLAIAFGLWTFNRHADTVAA